MQVFRKRVFNRNVRINEIISIRRATLHARLMKSSDEIRERPDAFTLCVIEIVIPAMSLNVKWWHFVHGFCAITAVIHNAFERNPHTSRTTVFAVDGMHADTLGTKKPRRVHLKKMIVRGERASVFGLEEERKPRRRRVAHVRGRVAMLRPSRTGPLYVGTIWRGRRALLSLPCAIRNRRLYCGSRSKTKPRIWR